MRVALIGSAGQLGTDLAKLLTNVVPLTHQDIEITDAASLDKVLSAAQPEIVLNTAAYNLVDQAEDEPERAYEINARGPKLLAEWCEKNGTTLVHVSTDYVFGADANRTEPYREDDTPGPVGIYGESKLAGEKFVREICSKHFVIRTCGLYGQPATKSKGNFVKTMLRLAGERDELRIVNDQHCTPSYTADVAKMIVALMRTNHDGLYHVTNAGSATWYEVASEAIRMRGLPTRVIPIPSGDYPTKAQRPNYSVLNCEKAERVTGQTLPNWKDALARYLEEISPKESV